MKVRTNSWHYRLYVAVRRPWPLFQSDTRKKSFWDNKHLVTREVKGHRLIGDDSFIDLPKPKNLCRYFWGTVVAIPWYALQWLPLLFTVAVIVIAYPFVMAVRKYNDYMDSRPRKSGRGKKTKGLGLFAEFSKAKKQKVCPLIEVVDE